jgi:hypothetical protein
LKPAGFKLPARWFRILDSLFYYQQHHDYSIKMPPSVPESIPTRDLEMPNTSPTLVVRLDVSEDEVKDDTTLTLAVSESQLSLDLLPICIGLISGPVLALY